MEQIKVSVIIPVYNVALYLKDCLDSVLHQTLEEFELICIDHGSTDNSLQILNEYAPTDKRMQVIEQEHIGNGAGYIRNVGLSLARGKYLSILDADDFFEASMLQEAYQKAEACDCDIVIFNNMKYDDLTKELVGHTTSIRKEVLPSKDVFNYLDIPDTIFQVTHGAVWNAIFKRKFILKKNIQFKDAIAYNDAFFMFSALVKAERISTVDKNLLYYRINNLNSVSKIRQKNLFVTFDMLNSLKNELLAVNLYRSLKKSFITLCIHSFDEILDKAIDFEDFKNKYLKLKNEYFEILGVYECNAEYSYYNCFEKVQKILQYEPDEWFFNRFQGSQFKYRFPTKMIPPKSKIVLYAAGDMGNSYYRQLEQTKYCEVVLWADQKGAALGKEVSPVEKIKEVAFDYVVVAVTSSVQAHEIAEILGSMKITKQKIVLAYQNLKC